MYIPVRIFTKNVKGKTIPAIQCPNCGHSADYDLLKQVSGATVMFIPIFRMISDGFAVCQSCGTTFPIGDKGYKQLAKARNVTTQDLFACINAAIDKQKQAEQAQSEILRQAEQAQSQKQLNIVKAGFSDKKQTVAVLLALFLKPFGAHHFYLGQMRLGLLCLGIFVGSMIAALMALLLVTIFVLEVFIIWGIVDAFRIGFGKYRDSDGKYVVSDKQRYSILLHTMPTAHQTQDD